MSEYSRRILAFSAIAIALGIGISLGITVLPINAGNVPLNATQTTTLTSTIVTTSTAAGIPTTGVESSTTGIPADITTTVLSTLTGVTTISSATTTIATSVVTTTVPSSVTTTSNSNSSSGASYGGNFVISAVSLTIGSNSSTLDVTLQTQGNAYVASATIYLNNTVIGTPPASVSQPPGNIALNIQPNQSSTIVLVIPSSAIVVHPGSNYLVQVDGWIGTPGQPANTSFNQITSVTAT